MKSCLLLSVVILSLFSGIPSAWSKSLKKIIHVADAEYTVEVDLKTGNWSLQDLKLPDRMKGYVFSDLEKKCPEIKSSGSTADLLNSGTTTLKLELPGLGSIQEIEEKLQEDKDFSHLSLKSNVVKLKYTLNSTLEFKENSLALWTNTDRLFQDEMDRQIKLFPQSSSERFRGSIFLKSLLVACDINTESAFIHLNSSVEIIHSVTSPLTLSRQQILDLFDSINGNLSSQLENQAPFNMQSLVPRAIEISLRQKNLSEKITDEFFMDLFTSLYDGPNKPLKKPVESEIENKFLTRTKTSHIILKQSNIQFEKVNEEIR